MDVTILLQDPLINDTSSVLSEKTITISDHCPVCHGQRGGTFKAPLNIGKQHYYVDAWVNPCGHIDAYQDLYVEYQLRQSA